MELLRFEKVDKDGWSINPSILRKVEQAMKNEKYDFIPGLEEIESVITIMIEMGYLILKPEDEE